MNVVPFTLGEDASIGALLRQILLTVAYQTVISILPGEVVGSWHIKVVYV